MYCAYTPAYQVAAYRDLHNADKAKEAETKSHSVNFLIHRCTRRIRSIEERD